MPPKLRIRGTAPSNSIASGAAAPNSGMPEGAASGPIAPDDAASNSIASEPAAPNPIALGAAVPDSNTPEGAAPNSGTADEAAPNPIAPGNHDEYTKVISRKTRCNLCGRSSSRCVYVCNTCQHATCRTCYKHKEFDANHNLEHLPLDWSYLYEGKVRGGEDRHQPAGELVESLVEEPREKRKREGDDDEDDETGQNLPMAKRPKLGHGTAQSDLINGLNHLDVNDDSLSSTPRAGSELSKTQTPNEHTGTFHGEGTSGVTGSSGYQVGGWTINNPKAGEAPSGVVGPSATRPDRLAVVNNQKASEALSGIAGASSSSGIRSDGPAAINNQKAGEALSSIAGAFDPSATPLDDLAVANNQKASEALSSMAGAFDPSATPLDELAVDDNQMAIEAPPSIAGNSGSPDTPLDGAAVVGNQKVDEELSSIARSSSSTNTRSDELAMANNQKIGEGLSSVSGPSDSAGSSGASSERYIDMDWMRPPAAQGANDGNLPSPDADIHKRWNSDAFPGANARAMVNCLTETGKKAVRNCATMAHTYTDSDTPSYLSELKETLLRADAWVIHNRQEFERQFKVLRSVVHHWNASDVILREKRVSDTQALSVLEYSYSVKTNTMGMPDGSLWIFLVEGMRQALRDGDTGGYY